MTETTAAPATGTLTATRFRLGAAVVDAAANTISADTGTTRLEPRVMAVLVHLSEHASDVVARADLLDAVWGDDASDEALTQAVSHLRRVLGDNARRPSVIETIPKRGYRLLGVVEPIETAKPASLMPALPTIGCFPPLVRRAIATARHVPLAASTLIGAGVLTAVSAASSPRDIQHVEEVRILADAVSDREATAEWLAEYGLAIPDLAPGEYRRIQQTTTDEAGAQRIIEFELIGPGDAVEAD